MINTQKYSMVGVMARLFKLGGRVFDCWRPLAIYAALLTPLALLAMYIGQICSYSFDGFCGFITQQNVFWVLFAMYVVIFAHLQLSFAVDFYDEAFNGLAFKLKFLWRRSVEKWQKELFLLAYLAVFLLLFAISIKLLFQQANPDWRIEMIYFTLVFGCFLLMILFMRMAASVSRFLARKRGDFKLIYGQTAGRAYVAIILFLSLLAFMLLCTIRLNIWLEALKAEAAWLAVVFYFVKIFMQLFFCALMLTFCRAQDELLEEQAE
ncbi:MAG: hypothetical protein IJ099_01010 [Alphaproteobacteria bacterium]|nr:hypothetical protein [Alphaproteobacteria bacterium]